MTRRRAHRRGLDRILWTATGMTLGAGLVFILITRYAEVWPR